MRLFPRSLAGQTVLVLLLGLTVSHLASMWIYSHEQGTVVAELGGHGLAARVADLAHLFEETPPAWRDRLVGAIDGPDLRLSIGDKAPAGVAGAGEDALRQGLAAHLGGREIAVSRMDGDRVALSVRLADGAWATFVAALPPEHELWSGRALLSMALMTLGVLLAAAWAVRRFTRPLALFAAAAERLGKDVAAPPLPLAGPVEVQRASAAFNRMQDSLRRLVANRTQMLAAISHDLRTPITLLRLRAEFVEDAEERAKMLATLDEMEAMIASTLAFARDDAAAEERRAIDLAALLQSVCDDFADAGAAVELEAPARLPYDCRPLSLKRAFANLLDNAVKYGGGAHVRLEEAGPMLRVRVADQGPGIPADELGRVFTPFYRVEKSRSRDTGGVGLGLAVALAIVHAHGGEITLRNRPEGGLEAVVELPR